MLPADLDGNPPPQAPRPTLRRWMILRLRPGTVDALRIWEARGRFGSNHPSLTFGQAANFRATQRRPAQFENFNITYLPRAHVIASGEAGSDQALDAIGGPAHVPPCAYRYFPGAQPYEAMVVNHTGPRQWAGGRALVAKSAAPMECIQSTSRAPMPATTRQPISKTAGWGRLPMDWQGNMALGIPGEQTTSFDWVHRAPATRSAQHPTTGRANRVRRLRLHRDDINRWGDYSSMSVDPVDECTFWYTQEYTRGGWDWATRILAFRFPPCTAATGRHSERERERRQRQPDRRRRRFSRGIYGRFRRGWELQLPAHVADRRV